MPMISNFKPSYDATQNQFMASNLAAAPEQVTLKPIYKPTVTESVGMQPVYKNNANINNSAGIEEPVSTKATTVPEYGLLSQIGNPNRLVQAVTSLSRESQAAEPTALPDEIKFRSVLGRTPTTEEQAAYMPEIMQLAAKRFSMERDITQGNGMVQQLQSQRSSILGRQRMLAASAKEAETKARDAEISASTLTNKAGVTQYHLRQANKLKQEAEGYKKESASLSAALPEISAQEKQAKTAIEQAMQQAVQEYSLGLSSIAAGVKEKSRQKQFSSVTVGLDALDIASKVLGLQNRATEGKLDKLRIDAGGRLPQKPREFSDMSENALANAYIKLQSKTQTGVPLLPSEEMLMNQYKQALEGKGIILDAPEDRPDGSR